MLATAGSAMPVLVVALEPPIAFVAELPLPFPPFPFPPFPLWPDTDAVGAAIKRRNGLVGNISAGKRFHLCYIPVGLSGALLLVDVLAAATVVAATLDELPAFDAAAELASSFC